jgi:hypothetical protein
MNKQQEEITVELDQKQQDFLQRLGLAYLLNSKYGPSLKMMWARLVDNRVPIFFGSFIICFVVACGMTWRLYTVDKYNNAFRVENAELRQELADCPCKTGECDEKKIVVEFYKANKKFVGNGVARLSQTLSGELDASERYGEIEMSILHTAIHLNVTYPTLKRLIEMGADPNAQINSVDRSGSVIQDNKGNSVIVSLIRKRRWECAIDLIKDFDIDLDQTNAFGKTPHKIVCTFIQTRNKNSNPKLLKLSELTNPNASVANSK